IARTTQAANANTESRSPTLGIATVLVLAAEIGKEVERPCDEDGRPRSSPVEGAARVGVGFDTIEVRFGTAGEFLLRQRARLPRTCRNQRTPSTRQPPEHDIEGLVCKDRGDPRPVPFRQPLEHPV